MWPVRAVVVALFGVLAGCGGRPHPPVLIQGESVYRDPVEGFQFRPPPCWTQNARGESPTGPADRECLLVKYKRPVHLKPAFLFVSREDLPATQSLTEHLKKRLGRGGTLVKDWRVLSSCETLMVQDLPAVRVRLAGVRNGAESLKEVVSIHRGNRVYYFAGVFPKSEARVVQAEIRAAVASVSWD